MFTSTLMSKRGSSKLPTPETEYSVKDVAKIFGLQEARLRYWAQTGFVGPSVRRRGRFFYTFRDLIGVRLAKELLDSGLTLQRVRRNLDALRTALPEMDQPLARLKVCSDGDRVVVVEEDVVFQPESGQVVMDFAVSSLTSKLAEVTPLLTDASSSWDASPSEAQRTAYDLFLAGCDAEAAGDDRAAAAAYRAALKKDGALAAAHTNLGNALYRAGKTAHARACYESALECEPEQPEARFNLGNVLDDLGETELAIAELRNVCNRCPEFADAFYNLGLILARVGGVAQARAQLERYVELDPQSKWAESAREFLAQLAG